MGNFIDLLPIADLLDGRFFLIPCYQRGYRWEEKQIKDLLNDIYSFALKNKDDNEFYCLQPLIVKFNSWKDAVGEEQSGWELIDGQQRLTTIHLILSYLTKEHLRGATLEEDYSKSLYHIQYQVRPDTEKLLDSLNFDISAEDNIDDFHIKEAYKHIKEWFTVDSQKIDEHYNRKTLPKETREKVLKTLVSDKTNKDFEGIVQVIWYEIKDPSENEVATFVRINMGKIPLTNAELIKALFLQTKNFNTTLAKFDQTRIASEWDKIEFSFQKDDFWFFLNEKDDKISRIEFIFDLIYHDENPKHTFKADKDATFRFYNQKFEGKMGDSLQKTVKEEWDKISNCFMTLEEWYEDGTLYHHIGFLIHYGVPVLDLYHDYGRSKHKNVFEISLRDRIKEVLREVKFREPVDLIGEVDKIDSEASNVEIILTENKEPEFDLNYDVNQTLIKKVLLFLNIEQAVKQHKELKKHYNINREFSSYRFPFDVFKSEHWDVEHIDSYTSNSLTDEQTQAEWLKTAREDLQIKKNDDLYQWISDFGSENGRPFEELKEKIRERAEEEKNDDLKNSIGNLTLLDAETNRSYGNSLFCTKRRIIIQNDKTGVFIPNCTKMIFLKFFDPTGRNRSIWGKEDMNNYCMYIFETLKTYLSSKSK